MRAVAAAALLAVAALAAWAVLAPGKVSVTPIIAAPLTQTVLFSGRVGALTRIEIGATVTGRVTAVPVREGDRVAAGALLVSLDDDELRATLAQAEAALAGAQARVESLGQLARPTALSGRTQAEATLAASQAELKRSEALVAQGYLSRSRLDELERQVAVARAQVDAARAQVRANTPAGAESDAARLRVAEAAAARDLAAARLAATRLVAPAAGRIITRTVEPGQVVQPGKPLLVLAADGPTQLIALVDERYLARLAPGQRARVLADAWPDRPFDARIVTIAPGVDAARGAIEVKLEPVAPVDILRQDMSVSIEVILDRRERALLLPLAALRAGDQVYRIIDGRVAASPVRTGLRDRTRVEILDGLVAGDRVILGPSPEPGRRARASRETTGIEASAGGRTGGSAVDAAASAWSE